MPWFVKIEKGIVDKTTFDRYVSAHKDYVRDLISQGRAAKTGYWAERGGGMLLFKELLGSRISLSYILVRLS